MNSTDNQHPPLSISRSLSLSGVYNWFLHGCVHHEEVARDIVINSNPFQIGRRPDVSLMIPSPSVSKVHAEIFTAGQNCFVRDMGSTNGTYVNGQRVTGDMLLADGDYLVIGDREFRLNRRDVDLNERTCAGSISEVMFSISAFDKLLTQSLLVPHYQPLIRLNGFETIGYEALARSEVKGLENPGVMFAAAEKLNLQKRLSEVCREQGLHFAGQLPGSANFFVNTHPDEVLDDIFLQKLEKILDRLGSHTLTLEVHEGALTEPEKIRNFHQQLKQLGVALAYDDFGAGQSRLLELIEAPPDYLKFDMSLIRNIDQASGEKQRMVESLLKIARDTGTVTLAEGIETLQEAQACTQLGFELAQGYFFGKPAPVEHWATL